jgi:hypothetical protein
MGATCYLVSLAILISSYSSLHDAAYLAAGKAIVDQCTTQTGSAEAAAASTEMTALSDQISSGFVTKITTQGCRFQAIIEDRGALLLMQNPELAAKALASLCDPDPEIISPALLQQRIFLKLPLYDNFTDYTIMAVVSGTLCDNAITNEGCQNSYITDTLCSRAM